MRSGVSDSSSRSFEQHIFQQQQEQQQGALIHNAWC
jgi:hypothetical protein